MVDLYGKYKEGLERGILDEVIYWLGELANENSNDEKGKRAVELLDNSDEVDKIVDRILDSDDLWEDIHRRIEELAGINYRERSRVDESENEANEDYTNYDEPIVIKGYKTIKDRDNNKGVIIYTYVNTPDQIRDAIEDAKELMASGEYQSIEVKNEILGTEYYSNDKDSIELYMNEIEDDDYAEEDDDFDSFLLDESKCNKNEDYTQASNAGAIKVDIMEQPKKKNKKDKEDKALKSLPAQQVLIESKDSKYKDLEEALEKDIYRYMIDNYEIDIKDDEDLNNYDVESYIDEFISQRLINYEDENDVELMWYYTLNGERPYGIKVDIEEV